MDCEKLPQGLRCAYCSAMEKDKLKRAKAWFEEVTEADSNLIGFMGISQQQLVEMYEREVVSHEVDKMEQEKKIKYIGPDVDSDEDVEWELVLSGKVKYKKPQWLVDYEEKKKNIER